jgi:hypothetical protein
MFRITQDPSSGSDNLYLTEITYNIMVQMCLLCAWSVFGSIFCTCGVCVRCAGLGARLSLPDDGFYVIRNMFEYF